MTYVAKGARPGYDVKSAVDYLNTFNSSFPLLNFDSNALRSATFNHNLGYFPFFFVAYNASGVLPGAVNQFSGNSNEWSISTSQLVRTTGSGSMRCFIARLNLQSNFAAPYTPGSTTQAAINSDYEFKIAREGKSTDSQDMRDFAIHSNTISPLVHRVYNTTMSSSGGNYYATVSHGLPYTPLVFAYIKPSTNSLGRSTSRFYMMHPPIGTTDETYLVDRSFDGIGGNGSVVAYAAGFSYSAAPEVSIVILKDPFLKNTINIVYP
jgi:hypothetical protein